MELNNLTFYEKKVSMIEGTIMSEFNYRGLDKNSRGVIPYELTAFNFTDINKKNRKFLEIDIEREITLNKLANKIRENIITWVGVCDHLSQYVKVNNIWKGKAEIYSNLDYYSVIHHQLLPYLPFSYYYELEGTIMAGKELRFCFNNKEEIINLSFQLSKI